MDDVSDRPDPMRRCVEVAQVQSQERTAAAAALPRPAMGTGLRAVEGYLLVVLLVMFGYALVTPPEGFRYDLTLVRMLAVAAVASVSLWLVERRARVARTFVPWALVGSLALSALDIALTGGFAGLSPVVPAWAFAVGNGAYAVATVLAVAYVAASRRAREVLRLPLSSAAGAEERARAVFPKPLTWPWIRDLAIYYCAATIIGHWGEIAFCWLIVLGVFSGDYDFSHAQLWSWWLYPYPAEGIAMVLCVAVLYPFKEWLLKRFGGRVLPTLVVSFLAITGVCLAVDFLTGVTVNADYHLWDYRDLPFNFMGQVVLQNTLVYGIAATVVVWVVYPFLARCLARLRPAAADALFFALVGAYGFLEILYYVHLTPAGLLFG